MFEKLDQINWSDLEHFSGCADDVPKMLRAWIGKDEWEREEAMMDLRRCFAQRNCGYSAMPHVVPFMLEMLERKTIELRDQIVSILRDIASTQPRDFNDDREVNIIEQMRMAVAKGMDIYFSLLQENDLELQLHTVELLAAMPYHFHLMIDRMWLILEQTKDLTLRGALCQGLGKLLNGRREYATKIQKIFDKTEGDEKIAVAIMLAGAARTDTCAQAKTLLLDILRKNPWSRVLVDAVAATGPCSDQEILQIYTKTMAVQDDGMDSLATEIVRNLIMLGFGGKMASRDTPFKEFSKWQQIALQTIAENDTAWSKSFGYCNITREILAVFGLPDYRKALRRFIAT